MLRLHGDFPRAAKGWGGGRAPVRVGDQLEGVHRAIDLSQLLKRPGTPAQSVVAGIELEGEIALLRRLVEESGVTQDRRKRENGPPRCRDDGDGARRFHRNDSRLTAIWTFHRHGSLLRDQDRAPSGGQFAASTPNCLQFEAGAESLPKWEEIWPGPAMNLVGPLAACSPGLRLALALEIERHCSANEILQGCLIDLVACVDVDGAPGIPVEAGVE